MNRKALQWQIGEFSQTKNYLSPHQLHRVAVASTEAIGRARTVTPAWSQASCAAFSEDVAHAPAPKMCKRGARARRWERCRVCGFFTGSANPSQSHFHADSPRHSGVRPPDEAGRWHW